MLTDKESGANKVAIVECNLAREFQKHINRNHSRGAIKRHRLLHSKDNLLRGNSYIKPSSPDQQTLVGGKS